MADKWDNEREVLRVVKTKISGCFGSVDFEFAMHQLDKNRAKELRAFALTNKITPDEVAKIANDFLVEKGCTTKHIINQISEVKKFFGKLDRNSAIT
jgi:hypothetical protein